MDFIVDVPTNIEIPKAKEKSQELEYFVSIENCDYHHWQIELLIESFKKHNLENKLVIAVAKSPYPRKKNFTKNLSKHERLFGHENIGLERSFLPLNKLYSATQALKNGILKQPFVMIDPDMILYKPLKTPKEEFVFQVDPKFTLEYAKKTCGINKEYNRICQERNLQNDQWLPIGSTLVLNKVPDNILDYSCMFTERFGFACSYEGKEIGKNLDRAGLSLAFLYYFDYITMKGVYDFEMTMLDHRMENNFIHYEHGLPPHFNKRMFKYDSPITFDFQNPFDAILSVNPTDVSHYVHELINSYLEKK